MKNKLKTLILFTLLSNNLFSQSGVYFPFKIGTENFSIGKDRGIADYAENYKILNDSIIFAYNQYDANNNVFYSLDYGLNFKSESYSNFFGLKEKKSSIRKLITDKDKIYIQVDQEGNYDSTKIFVFDTNNPNSKPKILFTETGNDEGQGISLQYLFKDNFIGKSYKNLFIWKEKKWVKLDLPLKYDVLQSFESDGYLYTFFSDKVQGNNTNNSCYRTKDLKNWEILENFTFTYRESFSNSSLKILAIHDDKIIFNNVPKNYLIYDIKSKEIEENNVIKNKFGNTISCFSMYNKRLFIKSNISNVYEFKNNTLLDLGLYKGNGDIKFSFTDKFGIFSTDGIYFFDQELVSISQKNQISPKVIKNVTNSNTQITQNIHLDNIPVNELTKEQCFELLDRMVKVNNGVQMTSKNFTQYQASFNSDGFGLITDEPLGFPIGRRLVVTKLIKWYALQSININKLNFKHSCVCLKFPEGFYAYSQVTGLENVRCAGQIANGDRIASEYNLFECSKKLKNDILNNPNPSSINLNNIGSDSRGPRSFFKIIVNNEDAVKFVELIKRISLIEREETKNIKLNLISKESWNQDILRKWHVDNEGIFQGRYEEYNSEGKLVTFGDYKNNLKVGKWVIKGLVKVYPAFSDDCQCSY